MASKETVQQFVDQSIRDYVLKTGTLAKNKYRIKWRKFIVSKHVDLKDSGIIFPEELPGLLFEDAMIFKDSWLYLN